jgi:hypothetical protein
MKRNEIMSDLRSLSHFLGNWGKNVRNPRMLNNLTVADKSKTSIGYTIDLSEPLIFINIDIERHVLPTGLDKLAAEDKEVEVKLIINCQEVNCDTDFFDPIEELGVAIMIEITYNDGSGVKEVSCCWHLDKGDAQGALYSHPIYHMNFGGNHMVKQGDVFGKLLLLPSPRIIHPPMDIVLACDFIVRNFYTIERHKSLTENPGYKQLIANASERYWKNYSYALASYWNPAFQVKNLPYTKVYGH